MFLTLLTLSVTLLFAGGDPDDMQRPIGGFQYDQIDGKWDCGEYGVLDLSTDGPTIYGTYTFQDGILQGRVQGTTFSGTWEQRGNQKKGNFEFRLEIRRKSARPTHMVGKWNYAGDEGWQESPWNCARK